MGLDVSCHLIAGVPVERVTKHREKTKYDEDTGKPKQVHIPYKAYQIVGTDIEVGTDDEVETDDQDYAYGETLYCVDYESDSGWFFGVEIRDSGSHHHSQSWFEVESNDEAVAKAKQLLEKVGYSGEPKLIVYQNFSY